MSHAYICVCVVDAVTINTISGHHIRTKTSASNTHFAQIPLRQKYWFNFSLYRLRCSTCLLLFTLVALIAKFAFYFRALIINWFLRILHTFLYRITDILRIFSEPMRHITATINTLLITKKINFLFFAQWKWCICTYLLSVETTEDEIVFLATLNAMARKSEALHVAHYCLATGENRLFCKIYKKSNNLRNDKIFNRNFEYFSKNYNLKT